MTIRSIMLSLAVLILSTTLLAGCAKDACEESLFPQVELTLDIAPGVEISRAGKLRLHVAGVINGAVVPLQMQPEPISVSPTTLSQPNPTLLVTVSVAQGGGQSIPPGAEVRLTVTLVGAEPAGSSNTVDLGEGSVTFALNRNACNFHTVRIEPKGSTPSPDGGAGADSAGPDAGLGDSSGAD